MFIWSTLPFQKSKCIQTIETNLNFFSTEMFLKGGLIVGLFLVSFVDLLKVDEKLVQDVLLEVQRQLEEQKSESSLEAIPGHSQFINNKRFSNFFRLLFFVNRNYVLQFSQHYFPIILLQVLLIFKKICYAFLSSWFLRTRNLSQFIVSYLVYLVVFENL